MNRTTIASLTATIFLLAVAHPELATAAESVTSNRMVPIELIVEGAAESIAINGTVHVVTKVSSTSVQVHTNLVDTTSVGLITGRTSPVTGSQSLVLADAVGQDGNFDVVELVYLTLREIYLGSLEDLQYHARTLILYNRMKFLARKLIAATFHTFPPPPSLRLEVGGGTYFDRDLGLIGTAFLFNPIIRGQIAPFIDVDGPGGWNAGGVLRCAKYQPPGTAVDRSLCWQFVQPVTGLYRAEATVDEALATSLAIDAASHLEAPQINRVNVVAAEVTIAWVSPPGSQAFLVRVNPVPFSGVVSGEMVVSGDAQTATLSGLPLVAGTQYQATVFAFSRDVRPPDARIGPFNIGAHAVIFGVP